MSEEMVFDDGIPDFLRRPKAPPPLPKEEPKAEAKPKSVKAKSPVKDEPVKAESLKPKPEPKKKPPVRAKDILEDESLPKITADFLKNQISVSANKPKPEPVEIEEYKEPRRKNKDKEPLVLTADNEWGRLVAKPDTQHHTRKPTGKCQFAIIAQMITDKWVSREFICATLNVVDNTMRSYIGIMSHLPEYAQMRYRLGENRQPEYFLPVQTKLPEGK